MTHEEALELWKNVVKLSIHPERKRIFDMGAIFIDPDRVYVSAGEDLLQIYKGTVIAPEVYLLGTIRIGKDCIIGPGQVLFNAWLSDCVSVGARPNIHDATLRFGSKIGRSAEIVRSTIEEAATIQHFSYIGDAIIGRLVNIGAGVVIANFDGQRKNKTIIQDCAFVGSSSTIVATTERPIVIGEECFIGAKSLIRKGTDPGSVVVGNDRTLAGRKCEYSEGKWKIIPR